MLPQDTGLIITPFCNTTMYTEEEEKLLPHLTQIYPFIHPLVSPHFPSLWPTSLTKRALYCNQKGNFHNTA